MIPISRGRRRQHGVLLTARALIEVEKSSSEAYSSSKAHGLGKASLADVRGSELLQDEKGAGTKSSSSRSAEVVRRPSIANDSLEVSVGRRKLANDILTSCGSHNRNSGIRIVVNELWHKILAYVPMYIYHRDNTYRKIALHDLGRNIRLDLRCSHCYGQSFVQCSR